ncbi:hypothetical protein [Acinetobacter schindleri]|mgnify:FL=1|nr:hypothetical protein [Acinetobacter schindleri]APX64380.1 hypothetical protein AsACE_p200004 [Acinetobacter schindleri]MDD2817157.1 hypothetical protein [Thiotrichaceae bacterium]
MKTQVSPKTVLNLVENVLRTKKNAVIVMQGIYLKKGKAEIFITIGQVKLITVFFKGRTELLLTALKHDSMNEAEHQAKDFIEQINEVLDEVEKRN